MSKIILFLITAISFNTYATGSSGTNGNKNKDESKKNVFCIKTGSSGTNGNKSKDICLIINTK